MMQPAPIIQGPSPETISALLKAIEEGYVTDGPAFSWCSTNRVFLSITVSAGVIVHWTLEPARDAAEATSLRDKYLQLAIAAARATLDSLPPEARAALERHLSARPAGGATH